MQPNQPTNPWQQNPNQPIAESPTQMYAPTEIIDQPAPVPTPITPIVENTPIRWSAHEYIYKEKNGLWFILFSLAVLAFIALDILVLKSYTFSVLVVVMAVAVVVYSRRPPRVIDYVLSGDHGLYISEKLYHFNEFRAFGVINEGDHNSIMLIPVKRFLPGVSVYFPQEVGERIVDIFGARLPMETIKLDLIDLVIQKIRL